MVPRNSPGDSSLPCIARLAAVAPRSEPYQKRTSQDSILQNGAGDHAAIGGHAAVLLSVTCYKCSQRMVRMSPTSYKTPNRHLGHKLVAVCSTRTQFVEPV